VRSCLAVLATALGLLAPLRAVAQTLAPTGFTGHGTIVLRATFGGTPLSIGGPVVVERRDALYRFDLQSVQLPGVDPALSAALGAVLNAGETVVVYDGHDGSTRAWSTGNRSYYREEKPQPQRALREPAVAAPSDPLAFLGALTRASRDLQDASISIAFVGHSQAAVGPVSTFDVDLKRTPIGKPSDEVRGTLAFAENLDGIPTSFALQGVSGQFAGYAVKIDLPQIALAVPGNGDFTIPAGYRRVGSLPEILRPPGI
jgi:hypothetical protein